LFDVFLLFFILNFHHSGDFLKEQDTSNNFSVVLNRVKDQSVLLLQKLSLTVDILLNLTKKSAGGELGLSENFLDCFVEFLDLLRGLKLDRVLSVDVFNVSDLFLGLFSAFEHVVVKKLVRLKMLVKVDIVTDV